MESNLKNGVKALINRYNNSEEVYVIDGVNRVGIKKKLFKILLQILILVLVGYFATGIVQSTFATNLDKSPDVIIRINEDGSISQGGSLFGDNLLYPSTEEDAQEGIGSISGVIRISNQYKKIEVSNLGLGIKGELEIRNGYERDLVYNSFLDDVKIKIEKGRLFLFDKSLVNYTSLRNVLYESSNSELRGFILEPGDRFSIGKGETIDLKYTLIMDENVGNELQSITASMPIYINLQGDQIIDENNGNNGNGENNGNNNYYEEIVEVTEPIPTSSLHWAHDCIITLLNHEIIQGYPHKDMNMEDYRNGRVRPADYVNAAVQPERYITRAEAAVLVGKALGLKEGDAVFTGYLDPIPSWAKGYIISTTKKDIFEGYPFRLFKPNKYITREEMIAVLTRAYKIKLENESLELTFKDSDKIAKWGKMNVKAGYESKVIEGYPDNTYRPKNNITRAETFTLICKLAGLHDEHTKGLEE